MTTTSTETSSAAAEALQQVLDRRARNREGRPPAPQRSAVLGSAIGGVSGSINRFGLSQWLFRVVVLGSVALVIGGAVATLAGGRTSTYTIAGVMLVGKVPLPHATISFHRVNGNGVQPMSFMTGRDGTFQSKEDQSLSSGLYAIVVEEVASGGKPGKPFSIPAMYRDAATTPLRVLVTESLSGLQLLIRR
ncbi:MAG: hypothetical protein WD060_02340 [Pirellulales bacterium]